MTVFLVASGGSGTGEPRALTSDEANRLAVMRFRNYEAQGRTLTITVPGTPGELVITGSVDYEKRLGYGVVHGIGRDTSSDALIQWTTTSVYVHPMTDAPPHAPASPPRSGWYSRPLQSSGSSLDSSLAIALSLGSDRPDNAQLLPQNGAAWVGGDLVDGRRVDVMTGPSASIHDRSGTAIPSTGKSGTASRVRYWVGSDGTMYRVRVALASEPEPVLIDFDTQKYVPVEAAPGVTPTP
ncbi:hypothetical protein [Streptomyces chartreusis]|uniref:hypothetical protein n=1 Tax=Streptomyces chartreusis TaxID=1969 RepID=UPI003D71C521